MNYSPNKTTRSIAAAIVFITLAFGSVPGLAEILITERLRDDGVTELRVAGEEGKKPVVYELNLSKHFSPASELTPELKRWESWKFGAFMCFNTNQFTGNEFCNATDPKIYDPTKLDVRGWIKTIKKLGMKYAVLTVRHTSGFLLYDSPTTTFDVAASGNKTDVVKAFVDNCRKQKIAPCFYYCLWGGAFNPNPKARETILAQLYELAHNYGEIPYFWIDMNVWEPANLSPQEIYDAIKSQRPKTIVICNQGTTNGVKVNSFPTDILNGEITTPVETGHQPVKEVGGKKYYLPFEFAPVSQARDYASVSTTPYGRGAWFTYGEGRQIPPSKPFAAKDLNEWIRQATKRGASNVLLSIGPDFTGRMREGDVKVLNELAKLLKKPAP